MKQNIASTLSERLEKARKLRKEGYNCAQAVIGAFDDITGIDTDQALRLTSGLGAGVGHQGEICGAILGASLAVGCIFPAEAKYKGPAAKEVKALCDKFCNCNGSILCHDLKGQPGKPSCDKLIDSAVELLHNHIL